MRTVIFMLFILLLYLGLAMTIGTKWTILLMALCFFIMATLFMIRKDYYLKYLIFTNPKYKKILDEKGEEFTYKNYKTNIICWYIISGSFLFQGLITLNNTILFQGLDRKELILFVGIIMFFSIAVWFVSMYILEKSKTNSEFVTYSLIVGVVITVILIIIVSIFIFNHILH